MQCLYVCDVHVVVILNIVEVWIVQKRMHALSHNHQYLHEVAINMGIVKLQYRSELFHFVIF